MLELLEMFPQAELFTSVYDPAPWPAQITERPVHGSFLNRIPGAARHYPKLLPLMNRAFRSFDLSGFDLVLSSSHACAKNVRAPPAALHVCYCHTPMRYAWEEGFLDGEEVGRVTRLLLPPLLARLRREDLAGAAARTCSWPTPATSPSASSATTGAQPRSCIRRSTSSTTSAWSGKGRVTSTWSSGASSRTSGSISRWRPARASRARAEGGGGRPRAGGRRGRGAARAHEFLGKVSEAERDRLLSGARALLFPGEEDFGIVPVEAQAAGVPVIAYGVGGRGRVGARRAHRGAVRRAEHRRARRRRSSASRGWSSTGEAARENARRFGRERFRAEMAAVIERASRERS